MSDADVETGRVTAKVICADYFRSSFESHPTHQVEILQPSADRRSSFNRRLIGRMITASSRNREAQVAKSRARAAFIATCVMSSMFLRSDAESLLPVCSSEGSDISDSLASVLAAFQPSGDFTVRFRHLIRRQWPPLGDVRIIWLSKHRTIRAQFFHDYAFVGLSPGSRRD